MRVGYCRNELFLQVPDPDTLTPEEREDMIELLTSRVKGLRSEN